MKHSDSTKEQANVIPSENYDGSTTRELAVASPKRPLLSLGALIAQVVAGIAGLVLVRSMAPLGITLLVLALILLPLTWSAWSWWPRYSKARIVSRKNLGTLEAGTWIATPGSRFVVRIWDTPRGARRNPSIADGLTTEELAIMAPVYVFRETPKGSEEA